jgi:dTMP kinase
METTCKDRRGIFISFEGGDGSGKSTQLSMLQDHLEKQGIEACFIREPGGTILGEKIRKIILDTDNKMMADRTEALLYAASRVQLIEEILDPCLRSGEIVICDRFVDSSIAYQGFGRGLGEAFIKDINKQAVSEYMPDLTVFLDLEPGKALRRLANDNRDMKDRLEEEPVKFHDRVYRGYRKLIDDEEKNGYIRSPRQAGYRLGRFLVVDAGEEPEFISHTISSEIDLLLLNRGKLPKKEI